MSHLKTKFSNLIRNFKTLELRNGIVLLFAILGLIVGVVAVERLVWDKFKTQASSGPNYVDAVTLYNTNHSGSVTTINNSNSISGQAVMFGSTTVSPTPSAQHYFQGITNGETVSGNIYVTYVADTTVTQSVQFFIDNVSIRTESAAPYALAGDSGGNVLPYDTTQLVDIETHYLKVLVTNKDSTTYTDQLMFAVQNGTPPTPQPTPVIVVNITSPVAGGTYSGTMTASATATTNAGYPISSISFRVDGNFVGSDNTSPFSININLSSYVNGPHTILATAWDTGGNANDSARVQFNVAGSITPTPTSTPIPTPTGPTPTTPTTLSCGSLRGIEKRFPCSPLVAGAMPEKPTSGTDAWDMFINSLYPGVAGNGENERFSAVENPVGSGVVVKNQNLLSDSENHTTVGTSRDLPNGSTECSAFRWLWKDSTEFTQRDWVLVWQLQQSGSPIVAIEVDKSTQNWAFKTRNGSDNGMEVPLGRVNFGHWAYFVVCTHLGDAPNGWTKVWYRQDGWPDVNAAPFFKREGHDTWQGTTGHNTLGIYAGGNYSGSYFGYFDRYGRALTPQRAVQLAGNP